MKKKRKGFTLVELLVVIAILAILASVSILGYSSFTKKAQYSNCEIELTQTVNILLAQTLDGREHEWSPYEKATSYNGTTTYYKDALGNVLENQSDVTATNYGNYYVKSTTKKFIIQYTQKQYRIYKQTKNSDVWSAKTKLVDNDLGHNELVAFLSEAINLHGTLTVELGSGHDTLDFSYIKSITYQLNDAKCKWDASTGTYTEVTE